MSGVLHHNAKNLTGLRFSLLTAVEPVGSQPRHKDGKLIATAVIWRCRCECGNETTTTTRDLTTKRKQSCGCAYRKSKLPDDARRTHGRSSTRLYNLYRSMISRCENPRSHAYRAYGARGIKVCQRWRESFLAFAEDMGERPVGHSLERVKNDGDYAPDNCVWATAKDQANNRRPAQSMPPRRPLTLNGKTQSLAAWAKELGVARTCIQRRLNRRGLSIEDALTFRRQQRSPLSPGELRKVNWQERKAAVTRATSAWLTREQRRYMRLMTKQASATGMHVDHVAALRGKDAWGLHVPWNLQILPPTQNMRKGNR